jgi:hypothetical protein
MEKGDWKMIETKLADLRKMWSYTQGYRPWVDSVHEILPLVEKMLANASRLMDTPERPAAELGDRLAQQLKTVAASIYDLTDNLSWLPGGSEEFITGSAKSLYNNVKTLDELARQITS